MTRSERRAAMPLCTAHIDEMRSVFGDIEIQFARENGLEWGEQPKYSGGLGPFICANGRELTVGILTVAKGD